VAPADVDRDGDVDVLSGSFYDDKVAWHENAGGGGTSWVLHTISTTADAVFSVAAGDVDGDGDLDALSASGNDDKVAWYENAGGGGTSWVLHVIATTAQIPYSVAVADVDGDGDLDALSASIDDDRVAWYRNDGGRFLFTVSPCRLLDTRSGMPLGSGAPRVLAVPPACGIPAAARAVALNLTVVGATGSGSLKAFAEDGGAPTSEALHFGASQTRANNAVVELDDDGECAFLATVAGGGTVHLIVDVVGYFE
jgi:hypothetical protein